MKTFTSQIRITGFETYLLATLLVALAMLIIACVVVRILRNPFHYPYFTKDFNVSGRRNVHLEDLVDEWLCEPGAWEIAVDHHRSVEAWKTRETTRAEKSFRPLVKRRRRQLTEITDDGSEFRFVTMRNQTRYRQRNYQKTSYMVSVPDKKLAVDFDWLKRRRDALADIGFETTLRKYRIKKQRSLMTPELRRQITRRDNYTCKICGKYMPDGVGLHIDHIKPVSKGGKTVPSNLQVLCSKCNGSKSNR